MRIITDIHIYRFDERRRLLEDRQQKSKSWLKHLFDILYEPMGFSSNSLAGTLDIGAAARTLDILGSGRNTSWNLFIGSGPGNSAQILGDPDGSDPGTAVGHDAGGRFWNGDDMGIVVGSDNTAASPSDNAMGTKIVHGYAANQLMYSGTEVLVPTFTDPNGQMIIRRYFTNQSGGDVTIQEVGIYAPGWTSTSYYYIFCVARDVVAPAVVVHTTEILEVEYTVQITV